MIIIGANMGVSKMTKEHLGITLALKIPFFIVVAKIDICPENILAETVSQVKKILKSSAVSRVPIEIKDLTELQKCAEQIYCQKVCPIFQVSNVTMQGIDLLVSFLSRISNRDALNHLVKTKDDPVEFDINEHFFVTGVGIVLSGILKSGTMRMNQVLFLGPEKKKTYKQVVIKGIHTNRMPQEEAYAGEYVCVNIKPKGQSEVLNRKELRKGMVLLDQSLKPEAFWDFEAEILILHHSTTIKENYQAVLHCGIVRQSVCIRRIYEGGQMKNGDKGLVRFHFLYSPEYVKPSLSILLREGRTKILGVITRVFTDPDIEQLDRELLAAKQPAESLTVDLMQP